jgi:hypothetical protein
MIGPITDAERRGWQRRAVRVLSELLAGPGRDLPPLRWEVDRGASLVGRVEPRDSATARRHFEAWAWAVGAQTRPEFADMFGVHLRAARDHYDGLVTVVVVAEIDPDREAER